MPDSPLPRTVTVCALRADAVRVMDWRPVAERLPARMARADRYRFEKDRLLCVGGGLLMLDVLGIRDESELQTGKYGKPCAPGYPAFNLSHSGEWCLLAMGEADVGADIEQIDESNLVIAPTVFTKGERAWMDADPLERFHVLWTLKESVVKATGLGLNLRPDSFEVLPFLGGAPVALNGRLWHAASGALDGYRYAVCAPYPFQVEFRQITL